MFFRVQPESNLPWLHGLLSRRDEVLTQSSEINLLMQPRPKCLYGTHRVVFLPIKAPIHPFLNHLSQRAKKESNDEA